MQWPSCPLYLHGIGGGRHGGRRQTPSGGGRQACLHSRGSCSSLSGRLCDQAWRVGSGLPVCQGRPRPAWLPVKGGGGQPASQHPRHHARTDASIYEIASKTQNECRWVIGWLGSRRHGIKQAIVPKSTEPSISFPILGHSPQPRDPCVAEPPKTTGPGCTDLCC